MAQERRKADFRFSGTPEAEGSAIWEMLQCFWKLSSPTLKATGARVPACSEPEDTHNSRSKLQHEVPSLGGACGPVPGTAPLTSSSLSQ